MELIREMLKAFTRGSYWVIKQWVLYWPYSTTYTVSQLSSITLTWSVNGTPRMWHKTKKSVSLLEKESLKSWRSCGVFFSVTFFFSFYLYFSFQQLQNYIQNIQSVKSSTKTSCLPNCIFFFNSAPWIGGIAKKKKNGWKRLEDSIGR